MKFQLALGIKFWRFRTDLDPCDIPYVDTRLLSVINKALNF